MQDRLTEVNAMLENESEVIEQKAKVTQAIVSVSQLREDNNLALEKKFSEVAGIQEYQQLISIIESNNEMSDDELRKANDEYVEPR